MRRVTLLWRTKSPIFIQPDQIISRRTYITSIVGAHNITCLHLCMAKTRHDSVQHSNMLHPAGKAHGGACQWCRPIYYQACALDSAQEYGCEKSDRKSKTDRCGS